MKKIVLVILLLLLTTSLIGCSGSSSESNLPEPYNFELKFKEEYSDLISPELGATFLGFTVDTLLFYNKGFDDFEITEIEEEMSGYMYGVVSEYMFGEESFNDHEKEVLDIMLMQWDNMNLLRRTKFEHKRDEIQKSIGLKPDNEEEYYIELLQEIKGRVEETLEQAKKFID